MERLEIRTCDFSKAFENKDFRIDSQYYTQEPKKNDLLVYDKIGNVIERAQYGVSISMNEDNIGLPIYRMNEIHNMLCDLEVGKNAELNIAELETFRLNDRDVLFNRTNSYEWVGRTGIYRKMDLRNFVFASYLVRFVANQNFILPEYLSAFLNSKQGVWDIKRRARQSINQTNVNPEEVKNIDIPLLSFNIQNKIKKCFDVAHLNRSISSEKYSEANLLLLNESSLGSFVLDNEQVNVLKLSDSFKISGRLDAEFYETKYESYQELVLSNKNGFTYIKDEFEHITTKSKKDKKVYKYIEIGDINVTDGSCKFNDVLLEDLPANAKTLAKRGDILISNVRPYRGAVTIIDFDDNDLIVSGAFTVLREKKDSLFSNQVLKVLLRTSIYKDWLLKFNVGTQYPVIKDTDVLNLPIPIVTVEVQEKITANIKESQNFKKNSEYLLEVAKRSVEIAIEDNEEIALNYIEQNMI